MKDVDDFRLVLSAGRTGTLFLSRMLTQNVDTVVAEHELPPARWEHVWANLRQYLGTSGTWLQKHLLRNRSRRLRRLSNGQRYVEVNPMLCPCADLLPRLGARLHLVHMVREPKSWANSILRFKASRAWRDVIDYIPFGLPYPAPRPAGWRGMDLVEKTLWRWSFCNQMIWSVRHECATYALVKYEDLFSSGASHRDAALRTLLAGLALEVPGDLRWFKIDERANAAPERYPSGGPLLDDAAARICGQLAETLGYDGASQSPACHTAKTASAP